SGARTSVPNRPAIAAITSPPGACASRARRSASITVAPQRWNSATTVDLPAAMLPVSAMLSMALKKRPLIFIRPRHLVTMPTSRLVRFPAADHDRGTVPEGGLAVDEALVAAGRTAAGHADGLELVDDLGDREERGHGAERQAAEIHVDAGQHDAHTLIRERVRDGDDAIVQELHFVDRDDFGARTNRAHHRLGGVHRLGLDRAAVVSADRVEARVARVEVGLEDLDVFPGDHRAPHPAHELLAFAGEHHAGDDFDPAGACAVKHGGDQVSGVRRGGEAESGRGARPRESRRGTERVLRDPRPGAVQREPGSWYRPMTFPPGSRNLAVIYGASAPMVCTISPPCAVTAATVAFTLSTMM